MKTILEEHCLAEHIRGLLLMSMPTGFGKTHNVLDFIFQYHPELEAQGRKIIFITNLKKNLPTSDLEQRFKAAGIPDKFREKVLFIDSNLDSVIENLPKVASDIPEKFKNESFKQLLGHIEALSSKGLPNNVRTTLKAELRKSAEPAFRKYITEHLEKEFGTKKARLKAIRERTAYSWIGKLYPAVFTDEKSILFMSVDKFFRKNTTLVEKSYYFTERLTKDALIFIDEFDATKDSLLRIIIESGIKHRVSLLDLFLNIHSNLQQSECPEVLLTDSQRRSEQAQIHGWPTLNEIVDNFQAKASAIFDKYNLHHSCKSHADFSSEKRNFLFFDFQFHHVLDAKGKKIELVSDPDNRANWIKALKHGKSAGGTDVRSLLSAVSGFLKYFQLGIKFLADNYRLLKEEQSGTAESFPLEAAVRTVLNHFRLDEDNINFLASNIMEGAYPYATKPKEQTPIGQYFYDMGFKYHDIVDNEEHDTLSKIFLYNFAQTPEALLAGICSQALVVGISATAGLHTNIGNYDLEYLKYKLGDNFHELKPSHIERLKKDFDKATKGYRNIDLKVNFLGPTDNTKVFNELAALLHDQEAAEALRNYIVQANPDKQENFINFIAARYLRALLAWKYFVEHGEISAQLCLFNKFAKAGDPQFDLTILHQYAKLLIEDEALLHDENIDEIFAILTGDDFDEQKAQILSDLTTGKRRFILSTYQTIGAGQNLQYSIPESAAPIHINDYPARKEMDIDAIYMDRPTNLLVNVGNGDLDEDQFIKHLFQLEFLVENGSLSPKHFKSKLNQAFQCYVGGKRKKFDPFEFYNLYETSAYIRFANKVLIQATGRICRTNMKAKSIHVLTDSSLHKCLQAFTLPESVIPVREYAALLQAAKSFGNFEGSQSDEKQNRASSKSNQVAAEIHRMLSTPWSNDSIDMWKALRLQTLKQPVVSNPAQLEKNWAGIYADLGTVKSSYKYSQKNDYGETEIHFSDPGHSCYEVCESSSRLPELMQIPLLRNHCEKKDFATNFSPGQFMLLPPVFNNIYKGGLGEECGRVILQDQLQIALEELDQHEFEKFDFKTVGNIYIDFKLWNDSYGIPADQVIPNIVKKAEDCDAERVYIINILGSATTNFRPIVSNDGLITEVPYLIKNAQLDPEALNFVRGEFSK